MSKATMKDIAVLASVSVKTVSQVMNGKPCSQETLDAVIKAAEQLKYQVPNQAKSLRRSNQITLGLLFDNHNDEYVMRFQRLVHLYCQKNNYQLVIINVTDLSTSEILNHVAIPLLNGLIITPPISNDQAVVEGIKALGIPTVLISSSLPAQPGLIAKVAPDDSQGAELGYQALRNCGHTKIALVTGGAKSAASNARLKGIEAYIESTNGLSAIPDQLIYEGDFTVESGLNAAQYLLNLPEEQRPTAIFSFNDMMAAGVYRALTQLRSKEDGPFVSILGFDGSNLGQLLTPTLVSVKPSYSKIVETTFEHLASLLSPVKKDTKSKILDSQVPCRLTFGQSCKEPDY